MRRLIKPRLFMWIVPVAAAALVIACSSHATSPSVSGSLNVMLTDSPFSDAKALLVTFTEVSAHASGGGWVTVPFAGGATSRTCDVKRLVGGAQDVLGVGALPAGHYTGIRLTVSSATVYFTATTSDAAPCGTALTLSPTTDTGSPVTVSSGQLILNREFDLAAGTVTPPPPTQMLLDFNGDASMVMMGTGMYRMTPVVTVVSVQ